MADIQSATAEIRRGKKKEERRKKKPQGKNIMVCPFHTAAIKNHTATNWVFAETTYVVGSE